MKKLQQSNYGHYFSGGGGGLTVKEISSLALIYFLSLNNVLYQTVFQINQFFVAPLVIVLLSFIVLSYWRISKLFLGFLFCISFSYLLSIFLSSSFEGVNRSIAYWVILMSFGLVFFYGHKVVVPRSVFHIYLIVYLVLAYIIFSSGDRGVVNPNWVALTLFYLYFLVYGKLNVAFLLFGLLLSFFVFESRGTSVVYIVTILLFFSQKIFGRRASKIIYLLVYFSLVLVLFYVIHLLSTDFGTISHTIFSFSERGLGGREEALVQGYRDLVNSYFLGVGPASSGGYENPVTGGDVHIHFGLIELMLKYSGVVFFAFIYFMVHIIKHSSSDEFPMIGGAMMTVFFYNGLAPSHLGINLLLLLVISNILWSYKKAGQTSLN